MLIYTGGTIGMMQDHVSKSLRPFNFNHLTEQLPELKKLDVQLSAISFDTPIDSSNMHPEIWKKLALMIETNYTKHDGFVILHGSDTMAYTASALSFMLENLVKPVILTGSQLPMGIIRTDGKENLITAIEIAAAKEKGKSIVPEVCIYFEYQLYRGNRTHKYNAEHFKAFQSANYPALAQAGVHITYNKNAIRKTSVKPLKVNTAFDANIAILKVFPGISKNVVSAICNIPKLKAIVLETFGAGNASTEKWFIDELKNAIKKGITVYNVTQCNAGSVEQGKYETSVQLKQIGVVSGKDITYEAAICKLMFVLGKENTPAKIKKILEAPLCGEMSN